MNQKIAVAISPNPIKVSERVDENGNIIDPRTRQIIHKAGEETPAPVE